MQTVFRIESKLGNGPYISGGLKTKRQYNLSRRMCDEHRGSSHPIIAFDVLGEFAHRFDVGYYCGFTSIEQLTMWFDGFLPSLKNAGYYITEYKVEEHHILHTYSGTQISFKKSAAKLVKRHKWTEINKISPVYNYHKNSRGNNSLTLPTRPALGYISLYRPMCGYPLRQTAAETRCGNPHCG